jgi:hypothetical protein
VHDTDFMRSRIRSLLSLLLAVVFTANAVAPGFLHGCEVEKASSGPESHCAHMAQAPTGQGGHQDRGSPRRHGGCQCVGHACCVSVPALSSELARPALAFGSIAEAPASVFASAPGTRVDHLLPLAQAPPQLLS